MAENRVYDGLFNKPPSEVLDFSDQEVITTQEFKEESDINTIMARHANLGIAPTFTGDVGRYEDFATAPSFHEAMEIIAKSQQQFEALPAKVRERFDNDPGKFLEWAHDEKNIDEAERMGLLNEEAAKRRGDERAVAEARRKRAEEALAAAEAAAAAAKKGGDPQ